MEHKAFLVIALLFFALVIPVNAIDKNTKFNVVYTGSTTIRDALSSKADTAEKADYLSIATEATIKDVKFPYTLPESYKTSVTINGYKCTQYYCGYWITATRGGQGVKTDSPIWIYNPPYHVTVSSVEDTKANTITYTLKEDPKAVVEEILIRYASRQPLGKPTIGTKL